MPTENIIPSSQGKTFMDYAYAQGRITNLVKSWDSEISATNYRRQIRGIKVNVKQLRAEKKLKPNETYIPVRLIDTNIKREEPTYIGYLKGSRRLAIFKRADGVTNPNVQEAITKLEKEFTRVCQYIAWEDDFFQLRDAAATHKWAAMEVCFDQSKRGAFCFEYVEHDKLLFSLDSRELQANDFIIRVLDVSNLELKSLVASEGFDSTEVDNIIKSDQSTNSNNTNSDVNTDDKLKEIYKIFFRLDGIVYVAFYFKDAKKYLKDPVKLFLGRREQQETTIDVPQTIVDPQTNLPTTISSPQPSMEWVDVDETDYPFELLPYDKSEDKKIINLRGRVDKDEYKQEAACAIWSGFVNGVLTASQVQGAPKNPTGTGSAPKQTDSIIGHGKIWSEPMEFFNFPWPDPIMLKAIEALDIQNAQETNQQSYAVKNRKDSRKTATEVEDAQKSSQQTQGVQVTLFSTFIRKILSRGWSICKSQAEQGKISFLVTEATQQNDLETISQEYDLFAAGDVDVIERAEKIEQKGLFWPIVAGTPIAIPFLINWLKQAFPDEADQYEQMLMMGQQNQAALIMGLAKLLTVAVTGPDGNLKPEFQQYAGQLRMLAEGVQQATSVQQQGQPMAEGEPNPNEVKPAQAA